MSDAYWGLVILGILCAGVVAVAYAAVLAARVRRRRHADRHAGRSRGEAAPAGRSGRSASARSRSPERHREVDENEDLGVVGAALVGADLAGGDSRPRERGIDLEEALEQGRTIYPHDAPGSGQAERAPAPAPAESSSWGPGGDDVGGWSDDGGWDD